jgi:hypothetical protein
MEIESAEIFLQISGLPETTLSRYATKFVHLRILMPNLLKLINSENSEVRNKVEKLLGMLLLV